MIIGRVVRPLPDVHRIPHGVDLVDIPLNAQCRHRACVGLIQQICLDILQRCTLFCIRIAAEIIQHESGGDAFVICLDGVGLITVDGVDYELTEGQSIVMPAKHPHAVKGKERFKMLLVVVF